MPLRQKWHGGLAAAAAVVLLASGWTGAATAATSSSTKARLPYFASLKRDATNVRIGPASSYPVKWIFTRAALPVEVLNRYGSWRRIRDGSGEVGWVHAIMLSSRRMAVTQLRAGMPVTLRNRPAEGTRKVAFLYGGVLVEPERCDGNWCHVKVKGHGLSGYVPQARLWGVYPNETF